MTEPALHRFRFLGLLAALVVLLCVPPVAPELRSWRWFDAGLAVVVAAAILSHAESRAYRWIGGLAGAAAVALVLAGDATAGPTGSTMVLVGHLLAASFLVGSALLTVQAGLRGGEISLDTIFAAVCGYLLLGVAWAVVYSSIDLAQPNAFHLSDELLAGAQQGEPRMSLFVYFSFVTLGTLGYGDITPVSVSARTLAWLEAVLGQLYLAVLIAGLVGAVIATRQKRR